MANILRFDNANSLYYGLIDILQTEVDALNSVGRNPVLALPTGNTMIPFYRLAADREEQLRISKWTCFNLDEYFPITAENSQASFQQYMDVYFYNRLKQAPMQKKLNGKTIDPAQECIRYESEIFQAGGIDIAILGIGTNGHIAFNEPGSEFDSRTRLIELHQDTLFSNFSGKAAFQHSLTMGIGTLLEAKKIYVVALGKTKADAVHCSIAEKPSRTCPASGLQTHADVTWFLDPEAANLI